MSNDMTVNPMELDSTGVIFTTPKLVQDAVWTGITADGHQTIIRNESGGVLLANTKGYQDTPLKLWNGPKWVKKLYIEKIDSGKILLHINESRYLPDHECPTIG